MAAHVPIRGGDPAATRHAGTPASQAADVAKQDGIAPEAIPTLVPALMERLPVEPVGESGISAGALALLQKRQWPGGVAELERALLGAVIASEGAGLMPQDFPQYLVEGLEADRMDASEVLRSPAPTAGVADGKQVFGEAELPIARADSAYPGRYGVARLLDERGEMRPIGVLEEEVIRFAIDHYRGRMSEVARRLGIGRSTLYRKLKDYGIAPVQSVAS